MRDDARLCLAFSRDSEMFGSCTLPPGTFFKGTTGISWDIEADAVLCLAFSQCFGSGFFSGSRPFGEYDSRSGSRSEEQKLKNLPGSQIRIQGLNGIQIQLSSDSVGIRIRNTAFLSVWNAPHKQYKKWKKGIVEVRKK
jgi:hypothetical protein